MERPNSTSQLETGGTFWANWFGPIPSEKAAQEIRRVALGWYVIAAIQLVLSVFLVFAGHFPVEDLLDPVLDAIGGYFIQSRKSRAVAVVMFLLALGGLAVTVAAIVGATQGGRNIWLAVTAVALGWRGIAATRLYQEFHDARVNWRRVVITCLSLMGFAIVLAVVSAIILAAIVPRPTDDMYGWTMVLTMLVTVIAGLALVTRKYPFAEISPLSPDGLADQFA